MKYKKWIDYYTLVEKLYYETGNINVPSRFEYGGVCIGYWLSRQRTAFNQNNLSKEKKDKLELLGMVWNGTQIKQARSMSDFHKKVQLLKEYKREYGDTKVPQACTDRGISIEESYT